MGIRGGISGEAGAQGRLIGRSCGAWGCRKEPRWRWSFLPGEDIERSVNEFCDAHIAYYQNQPAWQAVTATGQLIITPIEEGIAM